MWRTSSTTNTRPETIEPLSRRFPTDAPEVARAQGPWLWTTGGDRYVDYLLGNCVHLLGHSHPRVVEAVREQAGRCTNVGDARHELAEPVAETILRHARKDALRFVNSGSEAVHLAIRVARAATGRPLVLKFEGHYHGWLSEQIAGFVPEPYSAGLPPGAGGAVLAVPWNDLDAVRAVCDEHRGRIAAILCEPILCHAGPIPPRPGFLAELRAICDASGALLVFDECITGFRVALGGAQELYGVDADIVAYSKTLGAGLPIGVCCGNAAAMDQLGPDGVYQAGTYDGNALSLAAAAAVLQELETGAVHARIRSFTEALASALRGVLASSSTPHLLHTVPGIVQFYFTDADEIPDHAAAMRTDTARYGRLVSALRADGVHLLAGDLRANPRRSWLSQWFVSSAHDGEALDATVASFTRTLAASAVATPTRGVPA